MLMRLLRRNHNMPRPRWTTKDVADTLKVEVVGGKKQD